MQVIHEPGLEYIQVDLEEVEKVLVQNGLSPRDFCDLSIFIQLEPPEKLTRAVREQAEKNGELYVGSWGMCCSSKREIYVMTNHRPHPMAPAMTRTLLHELNHFIHGGYAPGEWGLPYDERPSEIEAIRFAEEQMPTHTLITIPAEAISLVVRAFLELKALLVYFCTE